MMHEMVADDADARLSGCDTDRFQSSSSAADELPTRAQAGAKLITVEAPPGPLGIDFVARASQLGIFVASDGATIGVSDAKTAIPRGSALVSIDGCECTALHSEQIQQLMVESRDRIRRLIFSPPADPHRCHRQVGSVLR